MKLKQKQEHAKRMEGANAEASPPTTPRKPAVYARRHSVVLKMFRRDTAPEVATKRPGRGHGQGEPEPTNERRTSNSKRSSHKDEPTKADHPETKTQRRTSRRKSQNQPQIHTQKEPTNSTNTNENTNTDMEAVHPEDPECPSKLPETHQWSDNEDPDHEQNTLGTFYYLRF